MLPFLIQNKQLEIEMKQTIDTMVNITQDTLRYIANKATEGQSIIIRSISIELHQTYF